MKYISLFIFLFGCASKPTSTDNPVNKNEAKCGVLSETLVLRNQTVSLPAEGRFVTESHLITKDDDFPLGKYPRKSREKIKKHISRSCEVLVEIDSKADCNKVYAPKYMGEWTPAEGGAIGQGSVGDLRPTPEEEMWSGNMYWVEKTKPGPGTKFLASANGKNVVVVMGYETGPKSKHWLGGLQGEVHWALGSTDKTLVRLGRLLDQSLDPGPIECD